MVGKICTVCRRCSYVDRQLSFFTYPSDAFRRYEWLVAVDRMDLVEKLNNDKTRGNHRICEVHFEEKYITKPRLDDVRKCLSKDAFPTLCLAKKSMMVQNVPMSNITFLKPQKSLVYAKNVVWGNQHSARPEAANIKPVSTPSRYNLRPMKQEKRYVEEEDTCIEEKVYYNPRKDLHSGVKKPAIRVMGLHRNPFYVDSSNFYEDPSPFYKDPSPFCEDSSSFNDDSSTFKEDSSHYNEDPFNEDPSPFYVDPSQFCESVIRVSQSTQTPGKCLQNNRYKRKFEYHPQVKRVRNESATSKDDTFLEINSQLLSPSLSKLVKWRLSSANSKEHVNLTLFALNLYYSSNLYNLLKNMLSLPSMDTVKEFLLPKTTRLSEHFLNAFRCKINNMSNKERICCFSVGSIMLKPNLYYNIKYDRVIGLHDINGVQNVFLAKYAVLLMVHGILENWRQPIAYAFISEYDHTPEISQWIDEVLDTLIDIGLDIRVLVSDPRSEFLYASESRFVSPEKSFFTINGTDIFYTYDTTQLLRIVKNNLKSCDFYYGSNYRMSNNMEFFIKISNLCNMLNSKLRSSNSQYKRAFSNKRYQRNYLSHMLQLFQNLKVVRKIDGTDVTENMKFIEGFQVTIKSVLQLFEELNFLGVRYLLTSRLNQNHLHKFLAHVKENNCKVECTPRQFNRGFVRSFVYNMLKKPVGSNNTENSFDSEEFSQQLLDEEVHEEESIYNQPLLVHTTDYRELLPEKNAFVYICGYCYLKCIEVHKCDSFQRYLDSGVQHQQQKDSGDQLCSIRLGLNIHNSKMLPPDDFTEFLMLLENKFKEYFKPDINIHSLGQEILKELEQYGFGMPCPCFPIDYLKALFVRVRLFYTIRKNNTLFKKKKSVKSFKVFSL